MSSETNQPSSSHTNNSRCVFFLTPLPWLLLLPPWCRRGPHPRGVHQPRRGSTASVRWQSSLTAPQWAHPAKRRVKVLQRARRFETAVSAASAARQKKEASTAAAIRDCLIHVTASGPKRNSPTFVSGTQRMTKRVMIMTQPAKKRKVPHFMAQSIDRKHCRRAEAQHTAHRQGSVRTNSGRRRLETSTCHPAFDRFLSFTYLTNNKRHQEVGGCRRQQTIQTHASCKMSENNHL